MTPEQEKRCEGSFGHKPDQWPNAFGDFKRGYAAAIEREVTPAAAESDRYREALEQMAGPCSFKFLKDKDCGYCVQCIANNALKDGKEEA